MIGLTEFSKRIESLLKYFKKITKVLACYLIDKDGFIIAKITDDFMKNDSFKRKIVTLCTCFESLSNDNSCLVNNHNKPELISVSVEDSFFKNGYMILIQTVTENLTFLTVSPTLVYKKPLITEFKRVIDELSIYFLDNENQVSLDNENQVSLDNENQVSWHNLYKLV